ADVGAAEAVDRLLGVTDQEELAGHEAELPPVALVGLRRRGGKEPGDLGLEGVGVLELVEEEALEAGLGAAADLGLVAEEVARPGEEIVEGGYAELLALLGVGEGEIAQVGEQAGEGGGAVGGDSCFR